MEDGGGEGEGEDLDFVGVGGDGYEAGLGVNGEAPGADTNTFVEEGGWLVGFERRSAGGWSGGGGGRRGERRAVNGRGIICEDVAVGTGTEDNLLSAEVADEEVVDAVGAVRVVGADAVCFGGGGEVEDQERLGGEELLGPGGFVDVDFGTVGYDIHLWLCVSRVW